MFEVDFNNQDRRFCLDIAIACCDSMGRIEIAICQSRDIDEKAKLMQDWYHLNEFRKIAEFYARQKED